MCRQMIVRNEAAIICFDAANSIKFHRMTRHVSDHCIYKPDSALGKRFEEVTLAFQVFTGVGEVFL